MERIRRYPNLVVTLAMLLVGLPYFVGILYVLPAMTSGDNVTEEEDEKKQSLWCDYNPYSCECNPIYCTPAPTTPAPTTPSTPVPTPVDCTYQPWLCWTPTPTTPPPPPPTTPPSTQPPSLPYPSRPTGLSATAIHQRDVAVTWNSVYGVANPDGYELDTGNARLGGKRYHRVTGTGKSFSGLNPETTYSFRVRALGNGTTRREAWSSWSSTRSATTDTPPTMGVTVSASKSKITEGQSGSFKFTASPAAKFALSVKIDIQETGSYVSSYSQSNSAASAYKPTSVYFSKNKSTVYLNFNTTDDNVEEPDGSVKVTIKAGDGYQTYIVGNPSSATVAIEDDDEEVPDKTPSFAGKSISPIVVTKGVAMTSVILPQATGGDGPLTYSVSGPSASAESDPKTAAFDGPVHGGIRFNSGERKLYGTPTETQDANTYIYTVTDSDSGGKLPKDSATLSFTITVNPPKATPPKNLKVSLDEDNGDTALGLEWSRVLLAAEYKVEWKEHAISVWDSADHATTTDEKITISGLKPDTEYDFRVRAKGDGILLSTEWGDWDKIVSIWTDKEFVITIRADKLEDQSYDEKKYTLSDSKPKWSVLEHYYLDILVARKYGDNLVTKDWAFKLVVNPNDTGLQISENKECKWTSAKIETDWFNFEKSTERKRIPDVEVIRCGRGKEKNNGMTVVAKKGSLVRTYSVAPDMKAARHRDDNQVDYQIRNPEFMKTPKPGHISDEYNPDIADDINDAADAWNDSQPTDPWLKFEKVTSSSSADTIIKGYWHHDPATGYDPEIDECSNEDALGCATWGSGYPHLEDGLEIWIKFPPGTYVDSQHNLQYKEWTNNLSDITRLPIKYWYLPHVLMHEFGHTAGLDDDAPLGNAMSAPDVPVRTPTPYDVNGMKGLYQGHAPH